MLAGSDLKAWLIVVMLVAFFVFSLGGLLILNKKHSYNEFAFLLGKYVVLLPFQPLYKT